MAFTKRNRAAVKALVSCHETGKPIANYSAYVVLKDDAGITFGAHQATHKSGTLYKIVKMYCDITDSPLSKKLDAYVVGLKNPSMRHKYAADKNLKSLLIQAGKEPAMRFAQDKVFEVDYLEPATQAVLGSGWSTPLALAVVYDSMIQGGWTKVRDKVKPATEKVWIKNYVAARRKWLNSSSRQVVRNSVYRMTTFERLIANNNWDLNTPFPVHGVNVTDDHLAVWMASETPSRDSIVAGDVDGILVDAPASNFFIGNTEGIADDDSAGGSWDDGVDIVDDGTEDVEPQTSEPEIPIETKPTNNETGDPPKAGEPVPDAPAQEGEAIVGGRPQDPPVIIEQKPPEQTSGWKTWPATVTGFLGSIGVSLTALGTWIWGAVQDPTSAKFVFVIAGVGVVLAAIFGIVYLIIRSVNISRREKQAHEILMKELELKSMPDRYNVKVDRRGDVSNLNAAGQPVTDRRE